MVLSSWLSFAFSYRAGSRTYSCSFPRLWSLPLHSQLFSLSFNSFFTSTLRVTVLPFCQHFKARFDKGRESRWYFMHFPELFLFPRPTAHRMLPEDSCPCSPSFLCILNKVCGGKSTRGYEFALSPGFCSLLLA